MVNNWKAAEALQQWKVLFLDPSNKKIMEARKILDDPNYKWKRGEKDKSIAKFKRIEGENINLNTLNSAVMDLIEDHEKMTDMLTEIYAEWHNKIATDGQHPMEIMSMQMDIIQRIWCRIYTAIEPLGLDIKSPKQINDGE
jgi:hypothetical protein